LSTVERTPEEWREQFRRFAKQVMEQMANGNTKPQILSAEELETACKQALPVAKHALAEAGFSSKKIDAMSIHQVALIYTMQLHHELIDAAMKNYSLPYPMAVKGFKAGQAVADRARADKSEIIPIASQIYPAITQTRFAVVRGDRQIAALRVIEAFRIYAASHDGKLPDQLTDITEVPIPEDPITMRPFEYQRDGNKATLQGPTVRDVPLSYEITMASAN
jgi:protein-tyrosine-phosphatase